LWWSAPREIGNVLFESRGSNRPFGKNESQLTGVPARMKGTGETYPFVSRAPKPRYGHPRGGVLLYGAAPGQRGWPVWPAPILWSRRTVPERSRQFLVDRAGDARAAKPMNGINAPQRPDCVAGVGGLELRNVVANYLFESSPGFPRSAPNFGHGDHSRLSCGAGHMQLRAGSAGIFSKRSARALAIGRPRREGTNWPRSLLSIRR
jgi:hypothetical protein